jgi:putative phosphoserine phosphatase/1-acylglycerol-3-phosphate O-acyltransferase
MDGVLATRWAIEGGTYTGRLDGPFLWGRRKLAAVRAWAQAESVDLKASYAYSDSVYDVPMLRSVGNPVAVNPDLRLAAVAALNRWPVRHLDVPDGVAKLGGMELQDWFRPLNRPILAPNARFDIDGVEHIPERGPVIVAFNHRSYFDATAVNFTLARSGRPVRFLGKKEMFDAPLVGRLGRMLGGISVDRGSGPDEPLDEAIKVLGAGELIALAPQGTIPRGPAFFDPELRGRWGAARLAQATKAPVIPLGLWGTEHVWPRNQRLPTMLVADPPTVTVRVGAPVRLHHRSLDADTRRIMSAITDLLPPEATEVRAPTDEELARTYPPGYDGDPAGEAVRRPGTDT